MTDMSEAKRRHLISVITKYVKTHQPYLDRAKKSSIEKSKNLTWIWWALLASLSTQGNSRGYVGLMENKENLYAVEWSQIKFLTDEEMVDVFNKVFGRAKIRMPMKKAKQMNKNYHIIAKLGGPRETTKYAFSLKDMNQKISFLKQFHGIADKYSRNI